MSIHIYLDKHLNTIEDQLNYVAQQSWFGEFVSIICSNPKGNLASRSILDVFQWPIADGSVWSQRNRELANLLPCNSGSTSFDTVYTLVQIHYNKTTHPELYI